MKRSEAIQKKRMAIAALVVIVCVCLALVLTTIVVPARRYRAAAELFLSGEFEEAIEAFESANGYRDTAAQIEACRAAIRERDHRAGVALYEAGEYEAAYALLNGLQYEDSSEKAAECLYRIQKDQLGSAAVGSIIRFGRYEQDNDPVNGPEQIEWIVLDVDGTKALVISKDGLFLRAFNDELSPYAKITWSNCQLRTWLNETFIQTAFSPDHQSRILLTEVIAETNPVVHTYPGTNTKDKLFLLSMEEANRYFDSDEARRCFGTAFCYAQGAEKDSDGACWWWLRTPGIETSSVTEVVPSGAVFANGFSCGHVPNLAVRPAMWIDLDPDE